MMVQKITGHAMTSNKLPAAGISVTGKGIEISTARGSSCSMAAEPGDVLLFTVTTAYCRQRPEEYHPDHIIDRPESLKDIVNQLS